MKRALLLAFLALLPACRGKADKDALDAGRPAKPPPRIVAARTPAAGELLADLHSSKVSVSMVKDRMVKLPVTATMLLRDGRVILDGPSPSARLSIDLTTFDSSVPLRNERVKQHFFETNNRNWETVELSIPALPPAALATLRETRRARQVKLEGELSLHGVKKKIDLVVDAAYGPDGTLTVTSAAPFEVNVADYGLVDNLRRLSLLCKHDSIDEIVKVEVLLELPTK